VSGITVAPRGCINMLVASLHDACRCDVNVD